MTMWDGTNRRTKEPWHLDRKVPIALIATILIQTACVIIWAAKLDQRTGALELWQGEQKILQASDSTVQAEIKTRLSVLESQNVNVLRSLEKIEEKLDAIYRRGMK